MNDSIQRIKNTDTIEYAGETYYKETIGAIAKIPSNENILDEDAGKEKVKEKAEEKNVGVLKTQDPDNDIVENAEKKMPRALIRKKTQNRRQMKK